MSNQNSTASLHNDGVNLQSPGKKELASPNGQNLSGSLSKANIMFQNNLSPFSSIGSQSKANILLINNSTENFHSQKTE